MVYKAGRYAHVPIALIKNCSRKESSQVKVFILTALYGENGAGNKRAITASKLKSQTTSLAVIQHSGAPLIRRREAANRFSV